MKTEVSVPSPVTVPVVDSDPRSGEIKIVLHWNPVPRGFFGLRRKSVDLDLGCCYKLRDGRIMLVDGLQFASRPEGQPDSPSRQGCYTEAPFLWHHGDNRSTSDVASETISVNPQGLNLIESITIYAFIYEGASGWTDCNASVSVLIPGVAPFNMALDASVPAKPMCAVLAMSFSEDGNEMEIIPLSTFHKGHIDMSQAYGWPFEFDHVKKS